ncbi:MAG: N-acetyltransferase family protein [Butyricicoccus sp.]
MSKFVIRKATENDAESLLKIYEPYITNTTITFEYDVPTAEAFADRIRETAAAFPYLVCEQDGMITGYAYAHRIRERAAYDWDAELSIYLAQGTHGHGVGTTVLACLIDLLELQGLRHLYSCGLCRTKRASACSADWALRTQACGTTPAGSLTAGTMWHGWKSISAAENRSR